MIENNWISLVKPNKVEYKISENKKFGTVIIEPLEKGFGLRDSGIRTDPRVRRRNRSEARGMAEEACAAEEP